MIDYFGATRKRDEEKSLEHRNKIFHLTESYHDILRREGYSENVIIVFSFLEKVEMNFEKLDKGRSFLEKTGEEYAKKCAKKILTAMKEVKDFEALHDELSEKDAKGKSLIENIFLQRENYLTNQNCALEPASKFNELKNVFLLYDDEVKKNKEKFYNTLTEKGYPSNFKKLYSLLDKKYEEFKETDHFKKTLKTATDEECFKSFSEDYLKGLESRHSDLYNIYSSVNPENGKNFLMELLMQRYNFVRERGPKEITLDVEKSRNVIKEQKKIRKEYFLRNDKKNRSEIRGKLLSHISVNNPDDLNIAQGYITATYNHVDDLRDQFEKTAIGRLYPNDKDEFKDWLSRHKIVRELKSGQSGGQNFLQRKLDSEIVDALSNMSFRVSSSDFEQNVGLFFSDSTKGLYQNIAEVLHGLNKKKANFNQDFADKLQNGVTEQQVGNFFHHIDDLEVSFLMSKEAKKLETSNNLSDESYDGEFSRWLAINKNNQSNPSFSEVNNELVKTANNNNKILQEVLKMRRGVLADVDSRGFKYKDAISRVILKHDAILAKKIEAKKENNLTKDLSEQDKKNEKFYQKLRDYAKANNIQNEDAELIINIYKAIDKINNRGFPHSAFGGDNQIKNKDLINNILSKKTSTKTESGVEIKKVLLDVRERNLKYSEEHANKAIKEELFDHLFKNIDNEDSSYKAFKAKEANFKEFLAPSSTPKSSFLVRYLGERNK